MTCFRLSTGESLYHYCKRKGISYWTIQTRCDSRGLTPDEALTASPRQYMHKFYINGETLVDYCKRKGLPYYSIINRSRVRKDTIEDSVKHFEERSKRWMNKVKPLK